MELEINESCIDTTATFSVAGSQVMVTPFISEEYWAFRVKLSEGQAILGFPKFSTIGIGFAKESDWNTNLPCCISAEDIYAHIKHNKGVEAITHEDCLAAIRLVQSVARPYVHALIARDGVECHLCKRQAVQS